HRGDLGQDVDAVLLLVDHPLQATGLPLDPAQPLEDVVLVAEVARVSHEGTIPPRGKAVARAVGPGRSLRGRGDTLDTRVGDHGGMADPYPTTTPDKDLRRDIRRVTSILGETLARSEGDDLLALVEQVRAHAKEGRLDELPDFDLATITRLVRAFTAYFHLANHPRAGPWRRAPDPGQLRRGRVAGARRRPDRGR